MNLNGKVVIVTGGSGAIGSAICKRFSKGGAKVVAAARNLEKLEAVVAEMKAAGGEATALVVDVTDKASCAKLVEETVRIYGRVDCLVNCAGVTGRIENRKPMHEYDDELWNKVIATNMTGVFNTCKPVIGEMMKQGIKGSIINVGAATGLIPLKLQCAHSAANAGVFNFTKAMGMEMGPEQIRVNAIAPGETWNGDVKGFAGDDAAKQAEITSHIPFGRLGEADEISGIAAFLASDEASYISGAIIPVDGAWTSGYSRDF
ncbi:MAG: SDR family oxidoreductase [Clostridia bacterium]|nr:SDR family oxidoreductase [Clostridia bacterium]